MKCMMRANASRFEQFSARRQVLQRVEECFFCWDGHRFTELQQKFSEVWWSHAGVVPRKNLSHKPWDEQTCVLQNAVSSRTSAVNRAVRVGADRLDVRRMSIVVSWRSNDHTEEREREMIGFPAARQGSSPTDCLVSNQDTLFLDIPRNVL